MHRSFKLLTSLIILAGIVGCSSGGEYKMGTSTATALPAHPSMRIIVNPKAEGSRDIAQDLSAALVGQLTATGRYSQVSFGDGATDLVMNVDIVKYARVSVGERLLIGMFAGRNRVGTMVTITNSTTGQVVKTFDASGESAAHPLSSESGTSDAVREAAKEVAAAATN